MSSFLIIQQKDKIYFGADTAVSTRIDGKPYRVHNMYVEKIYKVKDSLIFCSGDLIIANEVISSIYENDTEDIEEIRDICIEKYKKYETSNKFVFELAVAKVFKDHSIVYQISPYYDFSIISMKISKDNETAILTGGIKTKEVFELAYENIRDNLNAETTFKNTYNNIAYEEIGGDCLLYKMEYNDIRLIKKIKIREKIENYIDIDDCLKPTLVIAETLIGKIIMGEKLIIQDEEGTFTIRGNLLQIQDRDGKVRAELGEYTSNKFGLRLYSKTGNQVILDEDGIIQTWQEGRTDNVDANNPLDIHIYIPPETLSIRKAILRVKPLAFRSYSRTTASGGSNVITSESGGSVSDSTEAGGAEILTSGDSGVDVIYGYGQTEEAAGHTHMFREVRGHKHYIDLPSHRHKFTVPSHTHVVSLPSHTHDIQHGIYLSSSTARNITIAINGIDRTSQLGGTFSSDRNNIDISNFLIKGQNNTIRLGSSQLGRIDASVFVQVFLGT